MVKLVDSRTLVEQVKNKYSNSEFGFIYDFSYLEYKLKEMLWIEQKIIWTRKTVSKNHLIKILKQTQSEVHRYIFNSNKIKIFEVIEETLDVMISKRINESNLLGGTI